MTDSTYNEQVFRKSRLNVELKYKSLAHELPESLAESKFYQMFNEHLSKEHSVEELQQNASELLQLIESAHRKFVDAKKEKDRQSTEPKTNEPTFANVVADFKEKERQIKSSGLDDDEVQELLIRLAEKRSEALEGLL